mgnify:CR=1 FL=1
MVTVKCLEMEIMLLSSTVDEEVDNWCPGEPNGTPGVDDTAAIFWEPGNPTAPCFVDTDPKISNFFICQENIGMIYKDVYCRNN